MHTTPPRYANQISDSSSSNAGIPPTFSRTLATPVVSILHSFVKAVGLTATKTDRLADSVTIQVFPRQRKTAFEAFTIHILTKHGITPDKQQELLLKHLPVIKTKMAPHYPAEYFLLTTECLASSSLNSEIKTALIEQQLLLPTRTTPVTLETVLNKAPSFDSLHPTEKEYVCILVRDALDAETKSLLDKVTGINGKFDINSAVDLILDAGLSSAKDTLSQLWAIGQVTRERGSVESTLKRIGYRPSVSQEIAESFSNLSDSSKPQVLSNLVDQILNKVTSSNQEKLDTLIERLPTVRATFGPFKEYLDHMKRIIDRHVLAGTADKALVDRLIAHGHLAGDRADSGVALRCACLVHPAGISTMNRTELTHVQNALSEGMSLDERAEMADLFPQKYTQTEIIMCLIAKRQYNEELSFGNLFKLLQRGHEMVNTLQSDTPFRLREDGEDVPAFMWFLKAKEGTHMSIKGSSGVTFRQGESGRFIQKFIDAGGQPRISTHYPVTRIAGTTADQGWGKDVPSEELRLKTPFGLGSILIHPIVKSGQDLIFIKELTVILNGNDLKGFLKMAPDIAHGTIIELMQENTGQPLTEIQVARRLQAIGRFDFDLGIKFESSGFGDTTAQQVAHSAGSGAGALVGLRPDLICKKSSELKLALEARGRKGPDYKSRREFTDDFGSEIAGSINQLALLIPGYDVQSVNQWKPEELKLSTTVTSGGTFTELITDAEKYIAGLIDRGDSISEMETRHLQDVRELVATIKSTLQISGDDVLREGNEHRINVETGYIAPPRSVSRSGSRPTSPCYDFEVSGSSDSSGEILKHLHLDPDTGFPDRQESKYGS
ncbi:hypothetical protein EBR57_00745 [bacterium]|nr:hypothetical protein [bacterium]